MTLADSLKNVKAVIKHSAIKKVEELHHNKSIENISKMN